MKEWRKREGREWGSGRRERGRERGSERGSGGVEGGREGVEEGREGVGGRGGWGAVERIQRNK